MAQLYTTVTLSNGEASAFDADELRYIEDGAGTGRAGAKRSRAKAPVPDPKDDKEEEEEEEEEEEKEDDEEETDDEEEDECLPLSLCRVARGVGKGRKRKKAHSPRKSVQLDLSHLLRGRMVVSPEAEPRPRKSKTTLCTSCFSNLALLGNYNKCGECRLPGRKSSDKRKRSGGGGGGGKRKSVKRRKKENKKKKKKKKKGGEGLATEATPLRASVAPSPGSVLSAFKKKEKGLRTLVDLGAIPPEEERRLRRSLIDSLLSVER